MKIGIEYKLLSKDWIIRLEKDGKLAHIVGSKFSINSITSSNIASDKYATYEILKNASIPVIEHKMIFNPKYRKGYKSDLESKKDITNYIKENGRVVLKANDGSCGNEVYLCKNYGEFSKNLNKIFKEKPSASLCPFYNIESEYRVILLDKECELIYGKKVANGNWKHNLSQGATAFDVNDNELKGSLKELAIKAVNEIGLRFASVDIIKLVTGELLIIEVNSGVTINKYREFVSNGDEIAKEVYKEAILKMLS